MIGRCDYITWEGTFPPSNECEMAVVLSKTVLNFKMIHIGKFLAILEFCIFFDGNRLKLPLCVKCCYLRNKPRIDKNDFF